MQVGVGYSEFNGIFHQNLCYTAPLEFIILQIYSFDNVQSSFTGTVFHKFINIRVKIVQCP